MSRGKLLVFGSVTHLLRFLGTGFLATFPTTLELFGAKIEASKITQIEESAFVGGKKSLSYYLNKWFHSFLFVIFGTPQKKKS